MRVIPVLDLQAHRAMHARGGARESYAPVSSDLLGVVDGDPLALVRSYRAVFGLTELYVADLDAITGGEPQDVLLHRITREGMRVWVDAGVTEADRAREVLRSGVEKVVIGLETLGSLEALRAVVDAIGAGRAVFSLDVRGGEPVVRAPELRRLGAVELARVAADVGIRTVIVLDLVRVGMGEGVDVALVWELRREVSEIEIVAGGGIGSRRDLEELAGVGADGVLIASALQDGRIGVEDVRAVASQP